MINVIIKQLQAFLVTLGIVVATVSPTPIPTISPITTPSPTVIQSLQGSPTPQTPPQTVNIPSPGGSSRNWSGYVSTQGAFSGVKGTWTIPSVSSSGHTGADVTWIGIGGVSPNTDLIQCGTQNLISSTGEVTTSAFYELLPATSQVIPMKITMGDSITASINETSANQWFISLTDNTNGQTFNTSMAYTSSHASAEWIEEAPSDGSLILPLDNFGNVQFTNSSAVQNSNQVTVAQSNAQSIAMVNTSNQIVAFPSSLGTDNVSFSIIRSSAESSAPVPTFDQNVRNFHRRGFDIGHFQRQPTLYPTITPSENPSSIPTPTGIPPTMPQPESVQTSSPSGRFWNRWFPPRRRMP